MLPNAVASDPRISNFKKDAFKAVENSPDPPFSPQVPSPRGSEGVNGSEKGLDGSWKHLVDFFGGASKHQSYKEQINKREEDHTKYRARPDSVANLGLDDDLQKIQDLKVSLARHESDMRTAWRGLDPVMNEYVSAIVDAKMGSVTKEVRELKKLVYEQSELIEEQRKIAENQKEQLNEKERRIIHLEGFGQELETQQRDVSSLSTRLDKQDQNVASAQKEVKDCSAQLWTSIDEARNEKETFQKQIGNINDLLAQSSTKLAEVESKLEKPSGNDAINQLSAKVTALKLQVQSSDSEIQKKMTSADDAFREYQIRTHDLESGMDDAKAQVAALSPSIDSLTKEVNSVKDVHRWLNVFIDEREQPQDETRETSQILKETSKDSRAGVADEASLTNGLTGRLKAFAELSSKVEALESASEKIEARIRKAAEFHGKKSDQLQQDISNLQSTQNGLTEGSKAIETYMWNLEQRMNGLTLEPFLRNIVHQMKIMYPYPDEFARRLNMLQEAVNRAAAAIPAMQRTIEESSNNIASLQQKSAAAGGPSSARSSAPASPAAHDSCATKFKGLQTQLIRLNQLFAATPADMRNGNPVVNGQPGAGIDLTGSVASGREAGPGLALARVNSFMVTVEALDRSYQRLQGEVGASGKQLEGFNKRLGDCEGKLEIHESMLATAIADKLPPPQTAASKVPSEESTLQQEREMALKKKEMDEKIELVDVHERAIGELTERMRNLHTTLEETKVGVASIREQGLQLERSLQHEVTQQGKRLDEFQSEQEQLFWTEIYHVKGSLAVLEAKTPGIPASSVVASPFKPPLKHPMPRRAGSIATADGSRRGTPASALPTAAPAPAVRRTPSNSTSTTPTTERRASFSVDAPSRPGPPTAGPAGEARSARGSSNSSAAVNLGTSVLGNKGRKRPRQVVDDDDEDDSGSYRPSRK